MVAWLTLANRRIRLFQFYSAMKMIKKAKIINISLASHKDNPSPTIHLSHDASQETFISPTFKQQQLLNDCYEAIKIISQQKSRTSNNQKKVMLKTASDAFLQFKKTEKETEIKLPISVAESIELILRKFIKLKAEQQQLGFRASSSKMKYLHKKKSSGKAFLLRKLKQNTEQSDQDRIEDGCYDNVFKMISLNQGGGDKLQNKVQELERQVVYYKQKMAEQKGMIAKLQARELLLRKKYNDELTKIVRTKNILNIQANFEKESEDKGSGKGLMNVNGRNISTAGQMRKKGDQGSKRSSSQSIEQVSFRQTLITKKKPIAKFEEYFKPYSTSSAVFGNYAINNLKTLKQEATELVKQQKKQKSSAVSEKQNNIPGEKFVKMRAVNSGQAQFQQKQKEEENQEESAASLEDKEQRQITEEQKQMEEKILQNMKGITHSQVKELQGMKDEQFQNLQMNGFYDGSSGKLIQNQS